jgi:TatD DNase family protein
MFVDSHAHVQHCCELNEYQSKIQHYARNLTYLVEISTNIHEILNLVRITLPGNVLPAAGLYPDQAPKFDRTMAGQFRSLIDDLKPRAIGEVGLDMHWHYATLKEQEVLFRDQIELSIEKDLPLIVHSRDAFEDTYRILSEYKFKQAVILHCFGYGPAEGEKFLSNGYTISFAGNLTYPKAVPLQETLKLVPIDRLLMETDCPYLSPQPVRGDKNNPLNVKYTYEYASALTGMDTKVLADQVEKNFRKIFGV